MARLTAKQRRELGAALRDAFPDQDALAQFIFDYLGENLSGYGSRYTEMDTLTRKLIQSAESADRTLRLVDLARSANPDNAALVRVAHLLQIAPSSAPGSGYEVLLDPENPVLDVAVLLSRLGCIEGQVGRVETQAQGPPVALGTAFLVGADMVLTCQHVVRPLLTGAVAPASAQVRFDYKTLPDGVQLNPGRAVRFAAEWLLDSTPPSPLDTAPVEGADPDPAQLDYALVRLAEPVGDEPRGPTGVEGKRRGWITAPPGTPLVTDSPLWIMQHPDGDPLKLGFATNGVERVNANGTRVRHRVNTEPGASGSPCFDRRLEVVGIHHYGTKAVAPHFNQAVPIALIRDRMHANGHVAALS